MEHCHISAPQLGMVEEGAVDHDAFSATLKRHNYQRVASIEMRSVGDNNSERVRKALEFVVFKYGDPR
jgi:sugar phosphate isomerase/epimerase